MFKSYIYLIQLKRLRVFQYYLYYKISLINKEKGRIIKYKRSLSVCRDIVHKKLLQKCTIGLTYICRIFFYYNILHDINGRCNNLKSLSIKNNFISSIFFIINLLYLRIFS